MCSPPHRQLLLWVLITAVSIASSVHAKRNYRRVCYYTNWAQYRNKPAKFVPENVPLDLCTHVVYAFTSMDGNRLKAFEWNDETTEWMVGMYDRFNNMKKKNPAIKTLLGVGGWNFGTSKMTKMLKTRTSRDEFIRTSIEFLHERGFDGLDLDFEYPAARGSPADDKWKFALLVAEMSKALDMEAKQTGKPRLLLTAAVAAGKSKIDNGYHVPMLARFLDFISIMTYDFHGKWEKVTGHNSPLYGHENEAGDQRHLNLAFAATYWVDQGTPPEKINVGLPLYGRSFTLAKPGHDGIGAPAKDGGKAGRYTNEAGYLAFHEICDFIRKGATMYWFEEQQVPYAVKGDQWVGFDNEDSLHIKVQWIKERGFGGVMTWALDLDDFFGGCGKGSYPLMRTINHALGDLMPGALPLYTLQSRGSLVPVNISLPHVHRRVSNHIPRLADQRAQKTGVLNGVPREALSTPAAAPNCKGREGAIFPDPRDCRQYLQCRAGNLHSLRCAAGTVFSRHMGACSSLADRSDCVVPTSSSPLTSMATPLTIGPDVTSSYAVGKLMEQAARRAYFPQVQPGAEMNIDPAAVEAIRPLLALLAQLPADMAAQPVDKYRVPVVIQQQSPAPQAPRPTPNAPPQRSPPPPPPFPQFPSVKYATPGGTALPPTVTTMGRTTLPMTATDGRPVVMGYIPFIPPSSQPDPSEELTFFDQLLLYYLINNAGALPAA
nr:chitinase-like protein 4 [Arenicola marina]